MKKLPIEQRIMIEQLTGKQTKMDGTPRKMPRSIWESKRQGFPVDENYLNYLNKVAAGLPLYISEMYPDDYKG
jgi:hypothetical protein